MNAIQQPPVNEVVLSVAIAPQDQLAGPGMSEVLGEWLTDYPEAQAVGQYEVPAESEQWLHGTFPMQVFVGSPVPRYWLTSSDRPYLVQVQNSYLALNWRRRDASSDYVHYDAIKQEFLRLLSTVGSNLRDRGGEVVPLRAELTYVNVIRPSEIWHSPNETRNLFDITFPGIADCENFSVAYSRALRDSDKWVGRVHLSLQSGHDPIKDEAQLVLNITARSGTFAETTVDSAVGFLDHAHVVVNKMFLDLLTPAAKDVWDLK